MVSGVGVRWGEPARDAEAMGAPSTGRSPDASTFIDGLGEGRRGQDQTEGEMGEVAKAEAEGRRVESGVVKRRRQDRQMLQMRHHRRLRRDGRDQVYCCVLLLETGNTSGATTPRR
jgi:hypothetical protein